MKIGIIPDVHGCVGWKKNIKNLKDCDRIVFLGDYVDSFLDFERGIPALENLKEIIKIAKEDSRIDLLVGNHEFENYWFGHGRCSGFQLNCYSAYHEFFEENADMFKIAVEYDGWVFSHAGFTKTWVNDVFNFYKSRIDNFEFADDPIKFSNQLLKTKNVGFFQYYDYDMSGYGDSQHQGPLWVRPYCLIKDAYYDKQVVGHTETRSGEPVALETKNLKVILCDTQSHAKYFILDTENPPEFLSLEEMNRKAKEAEKQIARDRSATGERQKVLREKYNLSKSVIRRLYLFAESEVNAAAEHNEKIDLWEHLEMLCKKEQERNTEK